MGCGNSTQKVSPDVKDASLKCYATFSSRLNQLSDIPPNLQKEVTQQLQHRLNRPHAATNLFFRAAT
jgi:hypothetical protein